MKSKINLLFQKINNHHFRNDFIFSYIVNLTTMFGGLVLMFLINRYGSLNIYGEVSIILAFGGVLNNIITAKSNEGVVKFAIKFKNSNEPKKVNQIIIMSIIIDIVLAVITVTLFCAVAQSASEYLLKDESKYMLFVYFGIVVAMKLLRNGMMGYLQSEQKFNAINSFNLLDIFLKVAFVVGLIFLSIQLNSANIIQAYMIGAVVTTIVLFIFVLPNIIKLLVQNGLVFCKDTYKEFISFTKTMYLATFIRGFAADMDNLILGFFTNPQVVGIYQVVKNLISPVSLISSPMGLIYYPNLNELYEKGKIEEFKQKIKSLSRYITLFSFLVLVLLIPFNMYILKYFKIEPSFEILIYFILQGIFMMMISNQWWIRIFSNIVNVNLYLKLNIFWVLYLLIVGSALTYILGILGIYISSIIMVIVINLYFQKKINLLKFIK